MPIVDTMSTPGHNPATAGAPAQDIDVTVRHNSDQSRYEAWVDGALAGYTEYRPIPDADEVSMPHTQVDHSFEGKGVGGQLVRGALDDLRAQGLGVRPVCPFVKAWIERHPDYHDMAAAV